LQDAVNAFKRGEGDYIHLPQPAVEQLLGEGAGHLAAPLGPVNGHISYSSFAATHRFLDARPEVVSRFVRGFYSAQRWLAANDAETVGAAVASFFPETPRRVVVKAIARYKGQDTWAKDPLLREDGYDALQEILLGAGLAKARQPYSRIVRTDFARAAMA
jgi:NitT/TauT family transport system substrate-binding protein